MHLLLPLLGLGAVGYLVFGSKPAAAAGTSGQTPAQLAAANASFQAAQQFDAQAQALGLTQAQAQAAYDTGLTPYEYATGVLGLNPSQLPGGGGGTTPTPAPTTTSPGPIIGAPIEHPHAPGGVLYETNMVDHETGAPVYSMHDGTACVVDNLGKIWCFEATAG